MNDRNSSDELKDELKGELKGDLSDDSGDGLEPPKVEVLGYPLAVADLETAATRVRARALSERIAAGYFVVTLNPEIVVRARNDPGLEQDLRSADLIVADGVGILWAARRRGRVLPGRVPGVELMCRVMELAGEDLRVYFLGGRPGVAERAAATARERWGVNVAGTHHGYFDSEEERVRVVAEVASAAPGLLLAALGERQESFLAQYRSQLGARVVAGVGGTLDVLAGEASRTPEWTRRLNMEWAWRVGLDRRRWHRIPRLIAFTRLVLSEGKGSR